MKRFISGLPIVAFALLLLAGCSGGGGGGSENDAAPGADALDGASTDVAGNELGEGDGGGTLEDGSGSAGYDLYLLEIEEEKAPLAVWGVEPSKGKTIGGEQVVVSGTGFEDGMAIFFGHQQATDVYVLSGKKATAITPAGFPGPVDVEVTNPGGGKAKLQQGFLYFNQVSILSVDPPAGPTIGGVPVVISGTGFDGNTTLIIGNKIAIDIKVMDDSTLLALTPPGGPGNANVSVSSKEGLATSIDGFFYYEYPNVEEISPAAGGAGGGSVVHISMAGAHEEAEVFFGETPATSVTFVDYHVLEVITPPAEVGYADVTVTTPYGSSTREDGFFYFGGNLPPEDLQVISVQPSSGPTSGGNAVKITAFGLSEPADTTVLFGAKVAQVESVYPGIMLLTVTAPPGPEGPADVTLMNSNGTDTLAGGYDYLPIATIHDVGPDHGPASGGTPVVVSGEGFQPDAQVYFGALPAANVAVLSPQKITAKSPMGSPGSVDVTVMQAGTTAVLKNGFIYEGPLGLFVVNPNFGSISGGTFLTLVGSGFAEGAQVLVGGVPCSHVTVLDYNVITAKVPPGAPGTVDVSVAQNGAVATLPLSFTYFDPVSYYGGTWGGQIYQSVNISVLDGDTGAPLADAFVMLWANPDTPYQGFTDIFGQVTFSGADLLGEQMVTASKECYSNSSVVEYNATNVTVYLSYNCPSMGSGMPPAFIPPIINGRVWGFGKYVVIPPGKCNYNGGDFPFLCQACEEDIDCGSADNMCVNLGDQGKKCLTSCVSDANCPLGFSCTSLQGGGEFGHCLPVGGKKIIHCSTTKGHFLGENATNGEGSVADDEGYFSLVVGHLGEIAVVCMGGVLPTCYSEFDCTFSDSICYENGCWMGDGRPEMTPYALGVARHVSLTASGQVINDVNIQMDIPMGRKVNVFFDDPHLSWEGPNVIYSKSFVDFGSDGVFEFFEFPLKWFWDDDTTLTFEHLPSSLTGNLEDATFAIFGAALTGGESPFPATFALLTKLTEFEDDSVFVKGSEGWEEQASGVKQNLYDLWGTGWTDIYGVGMDGTVVHFNGYAWQTQQSSTEATLRAVHGADGEVWAVGDGGKVIRFAGSTWEEAAYPKTTNLRGVWASAKTSVFVAGDYVIDIWNGTEWSSMPGSTGHVFNAIWGVNSQNVWAVGDYGKVVRLNNGIWVNEPTPVNAKLRDIWGGSPSNVWAVGDGGAVIHYDGVVWTVVESGSKATFNSVFGLGEDDVYLVGNKGTILHWTGEEFVDETMAGSEQDILALFGSAEAGLLLASGNHQIVLGPFVTPVMPVYPEDGATLEQNYLQWHADEGGPDASFNQIMLQQPGMMGPVLFWDFMADGDVTYVDLPDFPNIEGTPGVPAGFYIYTIQRVFKEGFDIDNYDFMDLDYRTWRSWSQVQTTFVSE